MKFQYKQIKHDKEQNICKITISSIKLLLLFSYFAKIYVVIDSYSNRYGKKVVDNYDNGTRLIPNSNFSSSNKKRLVRKSLLCYYECVKKLA